MKKLLLIFLGLAGLTQISKPSPQKPQMKIDDFHFGITKALLSKSNSVKKEKLTNMTKKVFYEKENKNIQLLIPTHGLYVELQNSGKNINLNLIFSENFNDLKNALIQMNNLIESPSYKMHNDVLKTIIQILLNNIKEISPEEAAKDEIVLQLTSKYSTNSDEIIWVN